MKLSPVKKIILTALMIALCVVLPIAFHSIPNGGSIFLPMHIPVLLCGLECGWGYGGLCGLVGPLLSSLLTGMPPAAILPGMMVECCVYGLVTGLMMRYVRTGKTTLDLYLSLVAAMLLGRVLSGIAKALIFTPGMSLAAWAAASFMTAIPGIIIQLVLIPLLALALTKAKLLPHRYEKTV